MAYVEQNLQRYDIFGVVETHLQQSEIPQQRSHLKRMGLNSAFTAAQPYKKIQKAGGATIFSKQRLAMIDKVSSNSPLLDGTSPWDWTAVSVPFAGIDVVFVTAYMISSLGCKGDNLTKLFQLSGWLSMITAPWLVLGDWNSPPEHLAKSGVLQNLNCHIIRPHQVDITCNVGPGALLDYGIMSTSLQWITGSLHPVICPWKTHLGLTIGIHRDPPQVNIRTLSGPNDFALPRLTSRLRTKLTHLMQISCTWKQAEIQADAYAAQNPCAPTHFTRRSIAYKLTNEQATSMGHTYMQWLTTMEIYLAANFSTMGLPHHDVSAYVGRGRGPVFTIIPLTDLKRYQHKWTDKKLDILSRIHTNLSFIYTLRFRRHGHQQRCNAIQQLLRLLDTFPGIESGEDCDLFEEHQALATLRGIRDADDNAVRAVTGYVAQRLKQQQASAYRDARASFADWAAAGQNDSRLFRWLKDDPNQPVLAQQLVHCGHVSAQPLVMMKARANTWMKLWGRDDSRAADVIHEMVQLRTRIESQAHVDSCTVDFSIEHLDTLLDTFDDGTATGADRTRPAHYKFLPRVAKEQLLRMFSAWHRRLAFPWQLLLNIIAMLPKPSGTGERPICLEPFLVRLFMKFFKKYGSGWAETHHGFWDDAIAGSSALKAALFRAVDNEAAHRSGFVVAEGLWDVDKFYDSFDLSVLIQKATNDVCCNWSDVEDASIDDCYDLRLLHMCGITYLASRVIRVADCYGEPLAPSASILQGGGQANNMAKIILHGLLRRWHESYRPSTLRQYVDDLTQRTVGTASFVLQHFPRGASALIAGMTDLRFNMSTKSSLVVSDRETGRRLSNAMSSQGAQISWMPMARDLGVGNAGGAKRTTKIFNSRMANATPRFHKARNLAKRGVRTCSLINASAMRKATWSHQVFGVCPSLLRRLRASAARALPEYRNGACTTTILAIAMDRQDPAISLRLEIIDSWLDLWKSHPQRRSIWKKSWESAYTALLKLRPKARWRLVTGGISALICTLLDMAWDPKSADRWTSDDGVIWGLTGEPCDEVTMHCEIEKSIRRQLWKKAALHHNGQGLDIGVYLAPLTSYVRFLRKAGKHLEASILTIAASAGLWTNLRCYEAGYISTGKPVCELCGAFPPDEFHRIWECIGHQHDPIWDKTKHLARVANRDRAALWTRGLIPHDWFDDFTPAPDHAFLHWHGALADIELPIDLSQFRGHWYSDASGGKNTEIPILRRVAWGVALVEDDAHHFAYQGAFAALLTGTNQTVNRGELMPVIWMATNTVGDLQLHSDSSYVVSGLNKAKHLFPRGKNADLWSRLGCALQTRKGNFNVVKVAAHTTVEQVEANQIDIQHFIGNGYADAIAGRCAELGQVPDMEASLYNIRIAQCRLIHQRIIVANRSVITQSLTRERIERPSLTVSSPTLKDIILQVSVHPLTFAEHRVSCKECCQSSPLESAEAWVKAPCKKFELSSGGFQVVGRDAGVFAGTAAIHASHNLMARKGVYFCTVCGCYASSSANSKSGAKSLRQACTNQRGRAGNYVISRMAKNLPPRPDMRWPHDI